MRYVSWLLGLGMFLSLPVWADCCSSPVLNKITLQLHAEKWLTTQTALANMNVYVTSTGQGLEKIQAQVMQKLNQLSSDGEWHIVSLQRQQDKAGLETVQIVAQARLPQTALATLREKTKIITRPGETYTLQDIQFVPAEDEMRAAYVNLRNDIYQQTQAELATLNKNFPEQKYYLHQIDFSLLPPGPVSLEGNTMTIQSVKMRENIPAPMSTPLAVGNKLELQAVVILSSSALPSAPAAAPVSAHP